MPARFPSFIPRATETWRHRLPETVSALVVSVADVAAAACVAEDGILLINAVTGEKLHELAGHKGGTLCLTFSHDGRLLLR